MDSRNSGGLYEHFLKIHIPLSHITFPFHNIYECSYILKMCTNACHKQKVKKIHITFHHFDHTPSPSLAWTKSKPSGELSLGASCHFLIRFCRAVSHVAEVQVGLLYPPVWGHVLGLVGLHVLLHGREAGAVLLADDALVG